jgi:photosystem II stability/assembly factor-like uncharacterized protein
MKRTGILSLATFVILVLAAAGLGQVPPTPEAHPFDPKLLDAFTARSLGPANMGGRVTSVAVVEREPKRIFVGTASGGLWKTVNNGTTWTPIFDHEGTASIGDVAVAPSDSKVVWVGTGESNARNSVSWGNGVYRSTDGGATWKHCGLGETAHISRIVVHPQSPDVAYVAALGRLWGPNSERGLFRTDDGGQTWRHLAYFDDDTGLIDLAMDPNEPRTLYVASFQCRRDAFSGGNPRTQFSVRSGLYRSTDGGENWLKLTRGLPNRHLGRCGVAVSPKDPRIVYAVVSTDKTDIRTIPGQDAHPAGDPSIGGVFRSIDRGLSWTKVNDLCPRSFYFGQIRVDPDDPEGVYVLGVALYASADGGKSFHTDLGRGVHADHHALWIDPADPAHLILGGDGGLNFSYDRGRTWEHLENLPVGQFYAVAVDQGVPYRVFGGLQDNGIWGGPSATRQPDGITSADWFRVLGGDGFACQMDPTDADTLFGAGQYGGLQRVNLRTGETRLIKPQAPKGGAVYRFNWCAPLLMSSYPPHALYFGGNHLFRSLDRGDHWDAVSPDLTRGKPGPSADAGHTLTALAESPLKKGLLYVGTDDGRVHVSRDDGKSWTEIGATLPGVPAERWITRLECSHVAEGTAYLTLDRHRQEDHRPYLFKTIDYGATWQPLGSDLPVDGPLYVIREDPRNPDLLFAGTESGLFVSLDAGGHWRHLSAGLPRVAIFDLSIHPRDRDLIIATHGRGIYILDIGLLEQLTPQVLGAQAFLFDPRPALLFQPHGSHGHFGNKPFVGDNPPYGAVLWYYLKSPPTEQVHLRIADPLGNLVAELTGSGEAGVHQVVWRLNRIAQHGDSSPSPIASGDYVVTLALGSQTQSRKLHVAAEK